MKNLITTTRHALSKNVRSGEWTGLRRLLKWITIGPAVLATGFLAVGMLLAWLAGAGFVLTEIQQATSGPTGHNFGDARNAMLILLAVAGAPVVVWRAWVAHRQMSINQEGHYTELFTKAVEQLGATKVEWQDVKRVVPVGDRTKKLPRPEQTAVPNIEVRLGAIYALERVMRDSPRDAGPIVETLGAYIRENCGAPKDLGGEKPDLDGAEDAWAKHAAWQDFLGARISGKPLSARADVAAALVVLGRRLDAPKPARFDGADPGILLKGANLQMAELAEARLEGADLSVARLAGADLGGARLEGADLGRARLEGANLGGARLEGADLRRARLEGASLFGARLEGANLYEARLEGADLSFVGLEGANLVGAKLRGAYLRADFTRLEHLPVDFRTQILLCFGNKEHTVLPQGIRTPAHWFEGDLREEVQHWEEFRTDPDAYIAKYPGGAGGR